MAAGTSGVRPPYDALGAKRSYFWTMEVLSGIRSATIPQRTSR
ncbi:hypothetical protein J2R96_004947 [Bradyrhizobium elkanii]|nr:hypothetical protein [Bradyrhizobium elkanii]